MDDVMALGSEEDQDCEEKADQGPGTRPLNEYLCVPLVARYFPEHKPSDNCSTEGYAEEDRNALGDNAVRYRAGIVITANDSDEQYGEWCIEDHLKSGVHGDENGAVLVVATSQPGPYQDLSQISSTRDLRSQESETLTMAMQRAKPTSTRPSRRPGLSGRNAHASASFTWSVNLSVRTYLTG